MLLPHCLLPAQTALWQSLHDLEDCAVLAVSWQDVDAILARKGQHKGATSNERLLVGQANVLTGLDGSDCVDGVDVVHGDGVVWWCGW